MAAGVGPGDGTTLTFAGAGGFTYSVTTISVDGISCASIGTGGMSDSIRTYTAGNITDWGTITVDFEYSGSATMPTVGGDGGALSFEVRGVANDDFDTTAYIENLSWGIPEGDKMTGSAVFRLTGAITQPV